MKTEKRILLGELPAPFISNGSFNWHQHLCSFWSTLFYTQHRYLSMRRRRNGTDEACDHESHMGKCWSLLSLVSACIYSSVSAATQGLHKLSKDGICSQSGAHRQWDAAPQLTGSNTCSCCHAIIWNMAGPSSVQNAMPRMAGSCLLKHCCHQEATILCKRTKILVLAPPLDMDGSGGQHPPQLCVSATKRSHLLEYANLCSALNWAGAVGTIHLCYFKVLVKEETV